MIGAFTVKAWVAWNEGRELRRLSWVATGPRAEAFPDHRFNKEAAAV